MECVLHEHGAECDERPAEHTRRENGEERTTEPRLTENAADAGKRVTPGRRIGAGRLGSPARKNPERDADEGQV